MSAQQQQENNSTPTTVEQDLFKAKEHLQQQLFASTPKTEQQQHQQSNEQACVIAATTITLPTAAKLKKPSGIAKKVNRCFACKSKVGLSGFSCKCSKLFCGLHRMPEDHACENMLAFKKQAEDKLSKELVKVVAPKVAQM